MTVNEKAESAKAGRVLAERMGCPAPIWLLLAAVTSYAIITWLNVRLTFSFADHYLSGNAGLRLLGSYLPHAITLVVVVLPLVVGIGRQSGKLLGLRFHGFLMAMVICVAFWLCLNALVLWRLAKGAGEWPFGSQIGLLRWCSLALECIVTQVFGNALVEEVVFRGFLFRQVWISFERTVFRRSGWVQRLTACVVSALLTVPIFVLIHIPVRLHFGVTGFELLENLGRVGFWGLVFTFLFAVSRNLWLVIGVHALTNRPCLLFEYTGSVRSVEWFLCLLLIVAIPLCRIVRSKSTKGASESPDANDDHAPPGGQA